jgi:hypothetical protein
MTFYMPTYSQDTGSYTEYRSTFDHAVKRLLVAMTVETVKQESEHHQTQ